MASPKLSNYSVLRVSTTPNMQVQTAMLWTMYDSGYLTEEQASKYKIVRIRTNYDPRSDYHNLLVPLSYYFIIDKQDTILYKFSIQETFDDYYDDETGELCRCNIINKCDINGTIYDIFDLTKY